MELVLSGTFFVDVAPINGGVDSNGFGEYAD
jgi:hypothetical protein